MEPKKLPTTKPKPPAAGLGRKKGALNKTTTTVKENILAVFNRLDGTAGMAEWARQNPTDFYRIYAKLLPTQITGEDGGPVQLAVSRIELVPLTKP